MKTLKPEQITTWQGRIIDVRDTFEFAAERMEQTQNVPLGELPANLEQWNRGEPILLMCKKGGRSRQGVAILESAGFSNVASLEGGIEACKTAGLPVTVVRHTIPIMRQVLIGAGFFVLLGLALSLVNPYFIAISWAVAVAMIAAGITGFCPMMLFLQKMPWNAVQVPAAGSSCSTGSCSTR